MKKIESKKGRSMSRGAGSDVPSRRAVLAASAAAVGSALVGGRPSAAAVHRVRRPSDSLRVGLIGAGDRGHAHLTTYGCVSAQCGVCKARSKRGDVIPGAELVAVCDTFEDQRRKAASHLREAGLSATYVDFREMLEKENLDAVIIATPDHLHTPIAMEAARAGCDAYIEKCFANSFEDALELGRVLESTGRLIQVGYQMRQDGMRLAAKKIADSGELGQVTMVQDFCNRSSAKGAWQRDRFKRGWPSEERLDWPRFLGPAPEREYDGSRYFEWRKYWDYGTGICGDILSHSLDSTENILGLGMPSSATASGGIYRWKDGREVPDTLTTAVEYPDRDLSVTFQCSLASAYPRHVTRFLGTDGCMELSFEIRVFPDVNSAVHAEDLAKGAKSVADPYIHIQRDKQGVKKVTAPTQLWLEGRGMESTVRDGVIFDTTKLHHSEFHECIRNRKQPSAGYEAALPSTIGSLLATQAYLEGRRVEWDAEEERSK